MYRTAVLAVLFAVVRLPAWASEPGQPLDCSDWVFLKPGHNCTPWIRYPCNRFDNPWCAGFDNTKALDNAGWVYRLHEILSYEVGACGGLDRIELRRHDGDSEEVVAYLQERCDGSRKDGADGMMYDIVFDDKNGRFLVSMTSSCGGTGCTYVTADWVASIDGFATTFDILQTYTPTSGPLSFRVPYMPEGFQYADYFDTYYGDLATVGDWSQARPLQCGYPATPPSVGDYLAVEDTLPTPAPGTGRYYVTAVTHAGQRRYGRQASGGVISGRDPVLLPECE